MSLTLELIRKKNETATANKEYARQIAAEIVALRRAMKIVRASTDIENEASASRMSKVTKRIQESMRATRIDYQEVLVHVNETDSFIKIKSNKDYKFYEEYISDDTAITAYKRDKPMSVKIDQLIPYEGSGSIKDIKAARDLALADLRALRKKRREVSFIEKEYTVPGLPFKPKYKVYASGGYGAGEEEMVYKDIWRGTNYAYKGSSSSNTYVLHHVPGEIMRLKEETKLRKVFEEKIPTTKNNYVGVEIEFISKSNNYDIAKLLAEVSVENQVCLKTDGSLRAEGDFKYCHELTVLVKEQEQRDVMKRILSALDKAGSRVNKQCGLHIHLDMRQRDKDVVFNNLVKSQAVLYAMNPLSRTDGTQADGRRDQTVYSRKIDISDFQGALDHVSNQGGNARYYGINIMAYQKFKTIEIRIHSGSTNYEKISNWIDILVSIARKTEKYSTASVKPNTFAERFGLDSSMLEYIEKRVAKFKDEKGNHITMDEAS